jgi:hypothetical protein
MSRSRWARSSPARLDPSSIGIPADALSPILQMLIAKEQVHLMTGSAFRHRSARLTGSALR